jgi:SagB-type dehydrogenase family enzyme
MLGRRTHRTFAEEPLGAETLSTLLSHSFEKPRRVRRSLLDGEREPSHGTLSRHFSFEVYPVVMRGDGVEEGVYRYDITDHALDRVGDIDDPESADDRMVRTAYDQVHPAGAAVSFLFTSHMGREQARYRDSRAIRNAYMQVAGHSHRLILTAIAMELRAFLSPALRDDLADETVGVDGFSEAVTYMTTVGR